MSKIILMSAFLMTSFITTIHDVVASEKNSPLSFYYTCPMHPEVHTDHSGDCPICHMTLIKKEEKKIADESKIAERKSISLDQQSFTLSGAKLFNVKKSNFTYIIKTFGKMNEGNNFILYVSEKEQRFLKIGSHIVVKIPALDLQEENGTLTKIDSYIDPMGRTIRVDGHLNLKNILKAETSLLGKIEFKKADIIVIPEEALLHSGENNFVFILDAKKSILTPQKVKIGLVSEGMIEIIEGLAEKDIITTNSNFLIDSESRMKFNYDQKNN
jgi:multidrug efflux pump subunit AcrA (membrane-fusion protein)